MKVKVILQKNVKGLGNAKSVVSVSRGYALNYLVPKGLAKIVSDDSAEKVINKIKNEEEAKKARALEEKKILESKPVVVNAKAGENDKLFGSITSSEIEEKIRRYFDLQIDKKQIRLDKPIKKLGEYVIPVKLYKGINASLKLIVKKEA